MGIKILVKILKSLEISKIFCYTKIESNKLIYILNMAGCFYKLP